MLSSKRHVLTISAVIATATMAAGLGTLSLAHSHAAPPAAATSGQAPAPFTWADNQEGGD